jgi:hypothetical protein
MSNKFLTGLTRDKLSEPIFSSVVFVGSRMIRARNSLASWPAKAIVLRHLN